MMYDVLRYTTFYVSCFRHEGAPYPVNTIDTVNSITQSSECRSCFCGIFFLVYLGHGFGHYY